MVGDMMFARGVGEIVERRGYEPLFRNVQPLLAGDYVSGNLETVVSDDPDLPEADKLIFLQSPTASTEAMVDAGFTTVSLANNHAMDHGIPGLSATIEAVEGAGLHHAGGGRDLDEAKTIDYQEFGDFTVATLSFTDVFVNGFIARAFQGGVLDASEDTMLPMIVEADANADLVIVNMHFGEEYDNGPSARQRELVEAASAAGADVIAGHHPHVALTVDVVGDTLVFYSLGNFVFDQGWSRTRESFIARYGLDEDGSAMVEIVPIYIEEATPRVVEGLSGAYRRARIFQRVTAGSSLPWQREGDVLVAEFDQSAMLEEEQS
nr:CapA family protein [Salsipaludibacter albus]